MGTYSFNVDGNDWATFQPNLASAPTQFGVGFWFETQNAGGNGDIVRIRDSSGTQIVRIYRADDLTSFYRNTTLNSYVPELHGNVWKSHMGIDVKLGASGWIAVYLNGVLVASYSGTISGNDLGYIDFGTNAGFGHGEHYYDDLAVFERDGGAMSAVPDYRFKSLNVTGNGHTNGATGSDADSTDNYLLVDEIGASHDSDTTYTYAEAADVIDLYTVDPVLTIPTGFTVQAVMPYLIAKKSNGAVATTIIPALSDGTDDSFGTAEDLPTSYGIIPRQAFTLAPDGGAWTQADIDNLEVGWKSAGAY